MQNPLEGKMKKIIITLISLLDGILCYAQSGYISTILIDSLEEFAQKQFISALIIVS